MGWFLFCGFARASFRFDSRIGVDAARAGPCATQTTVSKLELEGFCVPQSCEGPLFSVARYCQDKKTATGHAALRRVFCERRARQGYSGRQWLHVSFLKLFPYRSGQVESACGTGFGQLRLGGSMTAQPPRLAREVPAAAARCRLLRILRHRVGARHQLTPRAGRASVA